MTDVSRSRLNAFHRAFPQSSDVINACGKIESRALRDAIRTNGRRQDGRTTSMIRPIACEAGLLPRTHGSSLFTRGETQAIGVATLGGKGDAQRQDDVEAGEDKRFMLHYFFPPSSVGETGRTGGASRREVGHGNLAERALNPVLPSEADFPFVTRLESTITESNGSSSMATVCAGTLALLDAGVPIKRCVFFFFRRFARPRHKSQVLKNTLRRITSVMYGERSSHNLATFKRLLRRVLRRARPPR